MPGLTDMTVVPLQKGDMMVKMPFKRVGGGSRFHSAHERVARFARGLMLAAALALATPVNAFACTQVWMPGAYTVNGDRYVGRAEDSYSRYVKIFGIEPASQDVTYSSAEGTFSWQASGPSYRYTYVRDLPEEWDGHTDAYSEAGINEKGVSCSATLTTGVNDDIAAIDPTVESGIGEYNYASIVLGQSASAREAVELLGSIIDERGAYSTDQITISDSSESWLFCGLSGHQWIAFKLPADQASVNPNIGNLAYRVDLDDTSSCLHSADIVSMPEEHGLLKTFGDGTPDIAATYGERITDSGTSQWTRYAQGRAYFANPLVSGEDYELVPSGANVTSEQSLFFTPGKSGWTTFDMIRSLAARGEQTADLNANENGNLYSIGNNWMLESHMFQIRDGLSPDIATIQWEALSRSEFSVAVPIYSALITEVSPYFGSLETDTNEHAGYSENEDLAMQEEPADSLDYVLMDINTLCSVNREHCAAGMRAYLDALQREIIEQHEQVDAVMQETPAGDARTELANEAELVVVEQTYGKTKTALDELRAYLRAGDFSEPFVPSDYDAENDALVVPLTYADDVLGEPEPEPTAPTITAQPQSATYRQGDEAKPLSVAAEGDGLTFEWFTQTEDGAVSTGVTNASFTPSTAQAGTFAYFCRVTNADGLSADTSVATITVTANREPGGDGSETPATDSGSGEEHPTSQGDLPQTGDLLNPFVLVVLAGVGVLLVAIGLVSRHRSRTHE